MIGVLANLRIPTIVTSAEISEGVSPVHESGRLFRDLVAASNKFLASKAALVCSLQAGIATAIKIPVEWHSKGIALEPGFLGTVFRADVSLAGRVWPRK